MKPDMLLASKVVVPFMLTVAPSGLLLAQLLWKNPMVVKTLPKMPIAFTTAAADIVKEVGGFYFGKMWYE
jgi:hypothetical protein